VVVTLIGGLVMGFLRDASAQEWVFVVLFPAFLLASATVGALIASRQPRNAIGWILLATAMFWVVSQAALEVAAYAEAGAIPITRWVLFLDWLGAWSFTPGIYFPATFVFLLFPDGRLPSRRWRPVAWISAIGIIGITLGSAFGPDSLEDAVILRSNPYAVGSEALWVVVSFAWFLCLLGIIGSVAALVVRLRRSSGTTRQQVKWLAFAGAVAVAAFIIAGVMWGVLPKTSPAGTIAEALILLALLLIPIAAGVAILRHRLYDIDVVIRKTVVFGVLAAFITAVYVAVVLLVPIVFFGASEPVTLFPAVATLVIALAFQPLRRRANRFANRLVYGKRATPYELLSSFSERVGGEYGIEDVLPRMAQVMGEGTGARRADVWLRAREELRRVASWPDEPELPEAVPLEGGDAMPRLPDADLVEPVQHRGELLGALSLVKPRGDDVRPAERQLLRDLASQAGLVLRNVRLTEDLRVRLVELQESRQRLVTAQDEERRRLERNIHDGAQQQLVALSVKARLLKTLTRKDRGKAEELADQLQADTQDALQDLRDLARGIYPPLLADQGLAAALEAQARKAAVRVEIQPDGIGRYPQEAEATAYFCVLEALQNAAKYADPTSVEVRLHEEDGALRFVVTDDGAGFDVATTPRGAGLQNMADRVEALGGELSIVSAPGSGTTVTGRIPVSS
jgi:signal transduction histidine kinase